MLFRSAWFVVGPAAAAASRLVGETSAWLPDAAALTAPLKHIDAMDTSNFDVGSTSQHGWDLRLTVINDWPVHERSSASSDGLETGLNVTQLMVLSLIRGSAATSGINACFAIHRAHMRHSDAKTDKVNDGLDHDACEKDIQTQALPRRNCGFDLPRSCSSPNASWTVIEKEVNIVDSTHILAVETMPVGRASEEANVAAKLALERQFLVVSYNHEPSTKATGPVRSYWLKPQPVAKDNNKYLTKQEGNHRRRVPSANENLVVLRDVKTSDDDGGKAAADTAKVSMLVAAAALITAMLLAF